MASEIHHQSTFPPLSKGRSGGDCKQEGFSRNNLRISGFKGWFIKATQIDLVNAQVYEFQSTHPCRCDSMATMGSRTPMRFNPRTHMGCDVQQIISNYLPYVSIHAPTWGATRRCFSWGRHHQVSIHAPTWGATHRHYVGLRNSKFQSTHPHGVRRDWISIMTSMMGFQSTHPHGVRPEVAIQSPHNRRFNPRTHMGCDACFSTSGRPR